MRKTHYKVTLDVFVYSDEEADVISLLKESSFILETEDLDNDATFRKVADIQDITIMDIEVIDSR